MLFKIDINVESKPSYDTIFQVGGGGHIYYIGYIVPSKGVLAVITGDYRGGKKG